MFQRKKVKRMKERNELENIECLISNLKNWEMAPEGFDWNVNDVYGVMKQLRNFVSHESVANFDAVVGKRGMNFWIKIRTILDQYDLHPESSYEICWFLTNLSAFSYEMNGHIVQIIEKCGILATMANLLRKLPMSINNWKMINLIVWCFANICTDCSDIRNYLVIDCGLIELIVSIVSSDQITSLKQLEHSVWLLSLLCKNTSNYPSKVEKIIPLIENLLKCKLHDTIASDTLWTVYYIICGSPTIRDKLFVWKDTSVYSSIFLLLQNIQSPQTHKVIFKIFSNLTAIPQFPKMYMQIYPILHHFLESEEPGIQKEIAIIVGNLSRYDVVRLLDMHFFSILSNRFVQFPQKPIRLQILQSLQIAISFCDLQQTDFLVDRENILIAVEHALRCEDLEVNTSALQVLESILERGSLSERLYFRENPYTSIFEVRNSGLECLKRLSQDSSVEVSLYSQKLLQTYFSWII